MKALSNELLRHKHISSCFVLDISLASPLREILLYSLLIALG